MAMKLHPDKNKDVEGAAKSLARDLQGTVELLRDELGQADLQQAV